MLQLPDKPSPRNSPISRLPVELLLSIFQQACPRVQSRVWLTHTCRHWREVVLDKADLWTYIEVPHFENGGEGDEDEDVRRFLCLLTMQLDLTGALPLDIVFFQPESHALYNKLLDVLRERAAFPRWHSLVLRLDYVDTLEKMEDALFFASEAFPNLSTLTIVYLAYGYTVGTIQQMTISRWTGTAHHPPTLTFDTIDLFPQSITSSVVLPMDNTLLTRIYGDRLDQLSGLVLPNLVGIDGEPNFLPNTIKKVEGKWRVYHPFPHIHTYRLSSCLFKAEHLHQLHSLVRLTVTSDLKIESGCHVSLPSLLDFSCGSLELEESASITAHSLQRLHMRNLSPLDSIWSERARETDKALIHDGFGLLPCHSLSFEDCISVESTVHLLKLCRHVEEVSITLWNDMDAHYIMENLLGDRTDEYPPSVIDTDGDMLCPRVHKLHFRILKYRKDTKMLEFSTAELVKRRCATDLKVYGMWTGEEDYVILA